MENRDLYDVLGVDPEATPDEIKRAYRKLARKTHPDLASGPDAEARFKAINEAYDILKDPQLRAEYDASRLAGSHHPGAQTGRDWRGGYSFHSGAGSAEPGFADAFRSMFGDAGAFDMGPGLADLHARISIAIEDTYRGAVHQVTIPIRTLTPDGQIALTRKDVSIQIPRGITQGQILRVGGQGADGDLFVEIAFAPHPVYRADGRDIFMDLPVTPWEAALGGHVTLPTPDGQVDLRIPANARTGQKLRLKGKGIPGRPSGDLYATLQIVNPRVSDAEARSLFETMARELPFDPRENLGRRRK